LANEDQQLCRTSFKTAGGLAHFAERAPSLRWSRAKGANQPSNIERTKLIVTPQLIHDDFQYSDSEHALYLREGYHFFSPFLTAEGLAWCRKNLDAMLERLQPGRNPEEILSAHQQESWLWELATQPRLLDMVEKQIGPNIVLWASQCLCKPPRSGRPVPWHQDAPYWNVSGKLAGGIWLPLDDIGEDNGAMAVLPGWHKKGHLKIHERGGTWFKDEIDSSVLPHNIDDLKVNYYIKAGALATHDTMIPHNSSPNLSDRWRRVIVLRYMDASGTMGDKTFSNYHTGEPFPRRFFLVRGEDVAKKGLETCPFASCT
jgi:hypothetical protein